MPMAAHRLPVTRSPYMGTESAVMMSGAARNSEYVCANVVRFTA